MSSAKKLFRINELNVRVYNSDTELAKDAAQVVQKTLDSTLKVRETARVIFATGNSQLKFLNALTSLNNIDWSRITCFHLDEYLGINAEHSSSFRCYLREKLEKKVKPQKFHYIEGDTLEPLKECDRYTQLLHSQPIDLCLLGVGANGHLAFNEPSVADFQDSYMVKLVKLDTVNHQQQVTQGHFPNLESVPKYAFTLTIPTICSAKKILCLAPGQHKAEVVKQMLFGEITKKFPASILRQKPQATLFLDGDSATSLDM
ncbi:glucosamine-6-phosphate deaminase [Mastigocoleus testarum]|uniref:Glucosamine-6-phosphate deaminase n=1 Tax=Mastigocoleus testarum BC008 TaxID=371196 RepID=A0A0V7ZLL4_9CYAN|nr:glucosamine-6-phosphate deaminase [Mastigocoleus testarum]KST65384.1 glucosamine-6-phosphate deaminase [Mastigocoleus testarum BC008]KST70448.1 glucosamine-6-phosphate deaminase [Mastigocoleus testarum BC008]